MIEKEPKNTEFTAYHEALGAKMAPFAGFNMPIVYSSIKEEHLAVRNNAGLFDVSHMGEFLIEGEDAADFVQKLISNDASKLFPGRAMYAYLPNEKGGIVDDLIVYMLKENKYMFVVNAANIDKDLKWINAHNDTSATVTDISDEIELLAVQGPKSLELLQNFTDINLSEIEFYHFEKGKFADQDDVILSATGYTGSGGMELYIPKAAAKAVWEKLMSKSEEVGMLPCGLAARDTLRLEMGYCLYGNDIDDTTNPLEAGLSWVTKFDNDFIGKDVLLKSKEEGLKNRLIAFELKDKGIARKDYPIVDKDDVVIGRVTSGTQSPFLEKAIGLGYIQRAKGKIGAEFFVQVRNKKLKAEIVKLPFYKK